MGKNSKSKAQKSRKLQISNFKTGGGMPQRHKKRNKVGHGLTAERKENKGDPGFWQKSVDGDLSFCYFL
jgi:hypothetical protein